MLYHDSWCYITINDAISRIMMLYHDSWCYITIHDAISRFMMLYHESWCYITIHDAISRNGVIINIIKIQSQLQHRQYIVCQTEETTISECIDWWHGNPDIIWDSWRHIRSYYTSWPHIRSYYTSWPHIMSYYTTDLILGHTIPLTSY